MGLAVLGYAILVSCLSFFSVGSMALKLFFALAFIAYLMGLGSLSSFSLINDWIRYSLRV